MEGVLEKAVGFAKSLGVKEVLGIAGAVWAVYAVALVVWRLWLCPIAHIPGPWYAKVSYLYEFYFDCVKTGQYTFQLPKLHAKYGPIIRINPHEVHIADPDFYDVVYAGATQKRDKWKFFANGFGMVPESFFITLEHDKHRKRRAPLNPFFSKMKVRSLQGMIEERSRTFCERVEAFQAKEGEGKEKQGQVCRVDVGFAAVTNDIVMQYSFGRMENRVEAPNFDPSFYDCSIQGLSAAHLAKHIPFLLTLLKVLPESWAIALEPSLYQVIKLQNDVLEQVRLIQSRPSDHKYNDTNQPTIFHEVLNSNLPAHEKSTARLAHDGQAVVVAGTLTTAGALSLALFHLLSQPRLFSTLKKELATAIPDIDAPMPPLATLEQLPYLTAVIKEALRLSNGVSTRLQRISPHEPVVYTAKPADGGKSYVMPPGTPMGLTAMLIHWDESIFPDPHSFKPERWLENPKLDKHLRAFNGGTRSCIGLNLAWAELYMVLGMMVRRFGAGYKGWKEVRWEGDRGVLELHETTERDVEIWADGIIPLNRPDSKGVRIVVKP